MNSLSTSRTALTVARTTKNQAVMQAAKAALIVWAAAEASQPTSGQGFQLGALPCPDINNDGVSDYSGQNCAGLLGRLPYKTLGIADLRDASGEQLWYAISSNFVRSTNNVINSDKQGLLTMTGLAPASNVIAVVLAPGARLGAQNRGAAGINTASNYLENSNGTANSTNFVTATENVTDEVNFFNDQLLAIAHEDLFSLVEPAVAARIQRDIVLQYIYNPSPGTSNNWTDGGGTDRSRYFDAWGAFPFAATFASPGSSSFTGVAGTREGLLPVADLSPNPVSSPYYLWSSGSVTQTGGSGVVWNGSTCSTTNSNSRVQCGIWYYYAPTFRMSGTANKVGLSFVQLPRLTDVSISGSSMSSRSISGSLNSSGAGIVNLDATMSYQSGWTYATVTIKNDNMIASQLISTGDPYAGWFNKNQWYKQTYYAVSSGYSGANTGCNITYPCLTVANLPAPYADPKTDTRAILILAGRSLNGATRPSATLSDYLEGQNASTGDYSFEHAKSRSATINDKVIVVAP
ncbi:MAG: hypothetical protein IH604_21550 [Burkholderiales bacterium]|nr:hypothetical protein [Burkholderiales bacterium]